MNFKTMKGKFNSFEQFIKSIDSLPKLKPVGADFDWKRVLNQALQPISQNKKENYQRYEWETDELAEWHTVAVGGL